jgi:uncharacterized protein YdeI (YjbR/CyaY-like superfamily)
MTKETINGEETLYSESLKDWRYWLAANCESEKYIWLILYHKNSGIPCVHWHDAIENALCFGWVDSKAIKRDKDSCYLKFSPRNPKSNWGKKSIERANKMTELGLMTEYGQRLINIAKNSGKWGTTETLLIDKL